MKKSILIWVGYCSKKWDINTWIREGIGGSECMSIKLAYKLKDLGYDVTIAGDVKTGDWWGVKWINKDKLISNRGPVGLSNPHNIHVKDHYNVLIGVNYAHFMKHLDDVNITYDDAWFWMHNEYYYLWHNGNKLDSLKEYFKHDKFRGVIGVSKYHEVKLKEKANELFNYTWDESNTYIRYVDNAIDLDDYKNWMGEDIEIGDGTKIPGRIIWTSSPDRGLDFILDNWKDWKKRVPELSLAILSPPYSAGWFDQSKMKGLKDVEWLGNKCPLDVKKEIDKSEYWIYISNYFETYCISALEMMMGKVKIITNGTGNIKHLIGGTKGIVMNNPDDTINFIERDMINPHIDPRLNEAYDYAVEQNWDNRVKEWIKLLNI